MTAKEELKQLILSLTPEELEKACLILSKYVQRPQHDTNEINNYK